MEQKNSRQSLWALVESLQGRLEAQGLDGDELDAAVIGRIERMFRRVGRNDQCLPLRGPPAPVKA